MSAEAAKAAFEPISEALQSSKNDRKERLTIVIATVKGDIHDIGKNIVCLLLENYGFKVIDLGRDVPPERILEATLINNAAIVGLSALMTTTVPAMEETVALIHEKAPLCKVVVGGAVLTEEYASTIGADKYCADAMEAVRYAESVESDLK
jgi:5-methyltetrahydrofolate--homocysteine methyltransferase